MKWIGGFFLLVLLSCQSEQHDLSWLEGKWKFKVDSTEVFWEEWEFYEGNYVGNGYSINALGDTSFSEQLAIINKDGQWHYRVSGVHKKPMYFKFTAIMENSFTCENSSNDFPKSIRYARNESSMKATLSNAEDTVQFLFTKAE